MSTETADSGDLGEAGPEGAVAELMEESAGIRACAVVALDGSVLAESSENDWAPAVAELWSAAGAEDEMEAAQVHVATEDGEVYAAREDGPTAIAITDRFTLASLMFCDLRSALRKLQASE
jgi:predicted regulator of Ras-like GTPase activity (Roadblock/LC7/MglB family)